MGVAGVGLECASSDISFREVVDPVPEVLILEAAIGQRVVGIAEFQHAHGQLYVDQSGRCFGASLVHPALWLQGETFEAAILALLTGRIPRPILLPGQESVVLYGETLRVGDPRLCDLKSLKPEQADVSVAPDK